LRTGLEFLFFIEPRKLVQQVFLKTTSRRRIEDTHCNSTRLDLSSVSSTHSTQCHTSRRRRVEC